MLLERELWAAMFGDFEGIRTLVDLCWSDNEVRPSILARVGFLLLESLDEDPFFVFLREVTTTAANGLPSEGTLDRIIAERSNDPVVREKLQKLSNQMTWAHFRFVAPEVIRTVSTPEMLFWHGMVSESARSMASSLRLAAIEYIHDQLVKPNGGIAAATHHEVDRRATLLGDPMLAGLILLVIASLDKSDESTGPSPDKPNRRSKTSLCKRKANKNASLNFATEVVDIIATTHNASTVLRRLKGEEVWQKWRGFAPLWAGVLAEANGQQIDSFGTADLQEKRIIEVVMNAERRALAFKYSHWFANFASNPDADGNTSGRIHIPAEEIICLPTEIGCEAPRPPLLILPSSVLANVVGKRRRRAEAALKKRAQRDK